MFTQEQLDAIIRKEKGKNAVEELVLEDDVHQVYLLSDGTSLLISKVDGHGAITSVDLGRIIRVF